MPNELEIEIQHRLVEALAEKAGLAARLAESEKLFNRTQAVAGVGSWHLDILANRLTWSNETYRIFGVALGTPQTLESFAAHIHPDDLEAVLHAWNATLYQCAVYDIEHRILVQGEVHWVRECAEITRDAVGNALVGIGTVQDITACKQAELEL